MSTGPAEYNRQLSPKRVDAVRNTLMLRFGIDGDRPEAIGCGEGMPGAHNRRVHAVNTLHG